MRATLEGVRAGKLVTENITSRMVDNPRAWTLENPAAVKGMVDKL
jgi:hypothetical protein